MNAKAVSVSDELLHELFHRCLQRSGLSYQELDSLAVVCEELKRLRQEAARGKDGVTIPRDVAERSLWRAEQRQREVSEDPTHYPSIDVRALRAALTPADPKAVAVETYHGIGCAARAGGVCNCAAADSAEAKCGGTREVLRGLPYEDKRPVMCPGCRDCAEAVTCETCWGGGSAASGGSCKVCKGSGRLKADCAAVQPAALSAEQLDEIRERRLAADDDIDSVRADRRLLLSHIDSLPHSGTEGMGKRIEELHSALALARGLLPNDGVAATMAIIDAALKPDQGKRRKDRCPHGVHQDNRCERCD